MDIRKMAHRYAALVIEIRHDLHMHPELSMHEVRTTRRVAEELDKLGIPYRLLEPTGLIAEIGEGESNPLVALRADMDALPIQEEADVPYKSVNDGVMHACGHDTHTAMLLGAAMVLNEIKDQLDGRVRLIFQPGEEIGAGAKRVIEQGGLEGVAMIFGIHIICPLPKGIVMGSKGPSHAASDTFRIRILGKGTHAASPHAGRDALLCAAHVVTDLQSVISREIDPMEPAVVTVGSFHSGSADNIIAGEAEIRGTIRTTTPKTHALMPEIFQRHVQAIAAAHCCTARIQYNMVTEVVNNDAHVTEIAMDAARKITDGKIICKGLRTLGGEDFGAYTAHAPASFFSIGAGGVGPMHGNCFCPEESVFEVGTALLAQFAVDALKDISI